jgi:hypothetical protein
VQRVHEAIHEFVFLVGLLFGGQIFGLRHEHGLLVDALSGHACASSIQRQRFFLITDEGGGACRL